MTQRRRLIELSFLVAGLAWSCGESPFEGATDTVAAAIASDDTTMFLGTTAIFTAIAQYRLGPGIPFEIAWAVTDTTKLELDVFFDLSASVMARDTGTSQLLALINRDFVDTVDITVVGEGFVRWRASLSGAVSRHPAIGADSLVRVVHNAAAPRIVAYTRAGDQAFSVASCFSSLSPALGVANDAFVSGPGCTARHLEDGMESWRRSVGGTDRGVAVAADGGVVAPVADTVVRFSAAGSEVWRDTLGAPTRGAPVIATNGDIYLALSDGVGNDSLARLSSAGVVRWVVPLPGLAPQPDPALAASRIVLSRPGGVFAVDTAGVLLWDRTFTDDNPGASAAAAASAPVLDAAGGVFVQTVDALYRYGGNGTLVWFADSLGYGPGGAGVGGPVLRTDGTLVVPCAVPGAGGHEVCSVRTADGALRWRSAIGSGTVRGIAVGRTGQVYATVTIAGGSSEVVALWSQAEVDQTGWPAAGGGMDRARRRS